MDNDKVILVFRELQKENEPDTQTFICIGKQDNDGIEGDAEFDLYHDDVDWCE